ncbi:GNAT family N-acetyltransferase, partial [Comamonas kerstersii]|uniref:GNAT family N-acetyltransferase n=1 Tax=Comamonas kerstersii TaxID=225992 RepID=UPI003463E999
MGYRCRYGMRGICLGVYQQRGRGVAGMLLRAVIDYGREHVEQIMLTVAEGNEAAINLYQRSARCPAPLQSPRRSAG